MTYIWWLQQQDLTNTLDPAVMETLPAWLQAELRSANGRAGRGRLWLSDHILGGAEVPHWTETALAKHCGLCAGIVITDAEIPLLKTLPGIVTDQALNRV